MRRMLLSDKVAVVTGTSPNIMGGIAAGLASEGAQVVCVDVRPDYAEGCADYITQHGGKAIGIACDVTKEDEVSVAIERALQGFGGIDILVNGAAFYNRKSVLDMPVDEWRRQIDVILTGAFLFTQHAARHMKEQGRGGSIINIASSAGHRGNGGDIAYGSAKGGIIAFTRAAAMDLAPHGIRVNSLTPTATDPSEAAERATSWGVQWRGLTNPVPQEFIEVRRKGIPLQRLASTSDYARVAAFLASDYASMITGYDIPVDGGGLAKLWSWNPVSSEAP